MALNGLYSAHVLLTHSLAYVSMCSRVPNGTVIEQIASIAAAVRNAISIHSLYRSQISSILASIIAWSCSLL